MPDVATTETNKVAFPVLDKADLAAIRMLATPCSFEDGQFIFHAGDADLFGVDA